MDLLSINQKVLIRRSDGRVHLATIIKLDGGTNNTVTVEWPEGHMTRGKELPLELVMLTNPHIYDSARCSGSTAINNQTASIQPRSTGRGPVRSRLVAGLLKSRVVTARPRITPMPCHDLVVRQIGRVREQRERRREEQALTREQREQLRKDDPSNPSWEVDILVKQKRLELSSQYQKSSFSKDQALKEHEILVCVRKRPLNRKELGEHELDLISVLTKDYLVVHEPRKQVNLVKFLEDHPFRFDYVFDEECSNTMVYQFTARPLVRHVFDGGMATCFAYGQTGSGKTHTMGGKFCGRQQSPADGIYAMAAKDVFSLLATPPYASMKLKVSCSFFEIYGAKVCDLLVAGKPTLRVLEDGHQQVQVVGLTENNVNDTSDVLSLLEMGNSVRTSGQTSANSKSSRSHAVFQIILRFGPNDRLHGKFSLIDLAGNERGADNSSSNRHTRWEGSEINKSLLALKECIRALSDRSALHLPFRGSKLTQVLRDSFIGGKKMKTCMIAMVSPGWRSVENTLNTLRYADRVKGLTAERVSPRKSGTITPATAQASSRPLISASDINSGPVIELTPFSPSSPPLPNELGQELHAGSGGEEESNLNDLSGTQRRDEERPGNSGDSRPQQCGRSSSSSQLMKSLATFRGRNFP
ncbi:hypothetical protein KR018_007012 [Drosophila ironensis]|nr:hypothetical protein KR018_007012 [Drosophila ironensis]